jgi:retinol dehydrogenase 14
MTGRAVLVTGATGGIGKATALGLAAMGARLAITGRDCGRVEAAAREIRAAGGGQVDGFVADLSVQAEVRRLAAEVLDRLARLDVLVNNVGGLLEHPAPHRRRAAAHLCPQPIWLRSCSPTSCWTG